MTDLIALVRHQQHLAMQYGREDIAAQWGEVADALKDAGRYRWLLPRFHAIDFAYDDGSEDGIPAIVFAVPDDSPWSADLSASIDAAMEGA